MHNKALEQSLEGTLETFEIDLEHEFLIDSLKTENQSLLKALNQKSEEDNDQTTQLSKIIEKRAILVKNLLTDIQQQSRDLENDNVLKGFAKAEYDINCQLVSLLESLRQQTKQNMVSLSKGRKAINKYEGRHVKLHQRASSRR